MSKCILKQNFLLNVILLLLESVCNTQYTNRTNRAFGWTAAGEKKTILDMSNNLKDGPLVAIKDGILIGTHGKTISGRPIASFRNIPYGQAPVGSLRFQAPRKSPGWTGVRDGTLPSPQCIQIDFMTRERLIRGQEDCLYLEVHTPHLPQDEKVKTVLLPVMVFFHGGSFASGAGGLYGPYYLLDQNVVLVTMNFRLGPFGFLSTGNEAAYGNAGMKDQVLGLQWVRENIGFFGGDSNRASIFGQSAGAGAIQHHIVSPLSRGLFHRGISHSGSSLTWWAISENAPELAQRVATLFNCNPQDSSHDMVACLQNVPANELVTAHLRLSDWNDFPIVLFAPVIEPKHQGAFLSEHPAQIYMNGGASKVPWITGFTKYEMGWLFADFIQNTTAVAELNRDWNTLGEVFMTIRNISGYNGRTANRIRDFYIGNELMEIGYINRYQIAQMLGDRFFLQSGLDGMQLHSHFTGESVYAYEFSFEGKYSIVQLYGQDAQEWGVAHLDDIIYLLNNTEHFSEISTEDTEEYKMSQIITSTWANFADSGIPYVGPNAENIWLPIHPSEDQFNAVSNIEKIKFLDLNLNPKMIPNPYTERYNFWKDLNIIDED